MIRIDAVGWGHLQREPANEHVLGAEKLGKHLCKGVRRRLCQCRSSEFASPVISVPNEALELGDLVRSRPANRLLVVGEAQGVRAQPRVDRVDVQAPHPPCGSYEQGAEHDTGHRQCPDVRDDGPLQKKQPDPAEQRGAGQDHVVE